jgi:hypothetical protein
VKLLGIWVQGERHLARNCQLSGVCGCCKAAQWLWGRASRRNRRWLTRMFALCRVQLRSGQWKLGCTAGALQLVITAREKHFRELPASDDVCQVMHA